MEIVVVGVKNQEKLNQNKTPKTDKMSIVWWLFV